MSLIGEENKNKPNLMENSIEEVRLRKRRRMNKEGAERMSSLLLKKRKEKKLKRKEDQFFTPEKLIKNKREILNDTKRFKRQERRMNNNLIHFDTNEGLIAVVRVKDLRDAYKATMKILNELNLGEMHSCVFMRKSPEVLRKLVLVEPYVAWGKPDLTTIQELLSKRAYTMIEGKKVPISDNAMVEDALADKGVICIADMQHEILTMGPGFDAVIQYLAPFVLTSPLSRIEVNVLHKNKIVSGNQGDNINTIIKSML